MPWTNTLPWGEGMYDPSQLGLQAAAPAAAAQMWPQEQPGAVPEQPALPRAAPAAARPQEKWGEPQKLSIGSLFEQKVPQSAFASPLRIPVPDAEGLPGPLALPPAVEAGAAAETRTAAAATSVAAAEKQLPPSALPCLEESFDMPPGLLELRREHRAELPPFLSSMAFSEPVGTLPPGLVEEGDADSEFVMTGLPAQKLDFVAEQPAPPGMSIYSTELSGSAVTCVDWQIDKFSGKLESCRSRPLVSPPFSACGLPNLRLMVLPCSAVKSSRRDTKTKGGGKKGPLHAALKLKADCLEEATLMTFSISVGPVTLGPFTYDFSQQAVHGPEDAGIDWLEQVEHSSGGLRVGVKIFGVKKNED
eukprot:TRINITY_DN14934_c0_g1_i1.p1 TRINITY_DN14934_c0_g1~~TRINITY_DN14934_c0_g1_i1.p1  ORF type:complete len:417 (+),score=80.67 TRINITY_DN14934_c0_g1_i1:168-1253(+)